MGSTNRAMPEMTANRAPRGRFLRTRKGFVASVAAAIVLAASLSACGSGPPSCSPSHTDVGPDGSVYFQQSGSVQPIPWGMQAKSSSFNNYGHWVVDVFADNTKVDHKDVMYPPHASVPSIYLKPGTVVTIEGTVTALGTSATIYGQCASA